MSMPDQKHSRHIDICIVRHTMQLCAICVYIIVIQRYYLSMNPAISG